MIEAKTSGIDWAGFLGRRPAAGSLRRLSSPNIGKSVLITGAGGCIGSALARTMAQSGVRRLILLESSEQNLYEIQQELRRYGKVTVPVLGDAGDPIMLEGLLRDTQPEIVYHAAAFKHVPLMELNPFAVVRNNAVGTYNLARAARGRVQKLIMISTDKAVEPASIMGASKRVAEMALLALSSPKTLMISVRLGNVLGSPGSVAPLFARQIAQDGPVTVTRPEASRYFLTLDDCLKYILRAAWHKDGPCILVPDLGKPLKIVDLAAFMIRQAGLRAKQTAIVFTRMRAGEKLSERLVGASETARPCADCGLQAVRGPILKAADAVRLAGQLQERLRKRDLAGLLRTLKTAVAGYEPGEELSRAAAGGKQPHRK